MIKGLCGCSSCNCNGGYQVHITIENLNNEILELLIKEDVELITIVNYNPIGPEYDFEEFITSKNYRNLDEAMYQMCILSAKITQLNGKIIRQKIESNPKNNHKCFYKEVHYKVDESDREKYKDKLYFSRNQKGTLFATERFFDTELKIRMDKPYIIEDVIIDTNPDWYFGISEEIYKMIPAAKLTPCE